MEIQIINPLDYPKWDDLLLKTPGHSFFHSSAWAKVLSESYQYTPTYFTVFDGNRLSAIIPIMDIKSVLTGRRGISLPFTDYCEPLIDENVKFQDLFNCIVKYGKEKGWKYLDLRGGQTHLPSVLPYTTFWGHFLDLPKDEKLIFSNFRDSTRRNIKKALNEGVDTGIHNSLESVEQFYNLNCMTRKEHGLPPQPYYFFKKVYNHIISKDFGFVILASYQGIYIAGSVYFHIGNQAIYKYGASDIRYQHLRANNLVMWEAIKWYCGNGYQTFHFGRTETKHQGLRQFKAGWGTKENTIKYYRYDLINNEFMDQENSISSFYHQIFRKLPIPLLKALGSIFYKHIA